MTNELEHTLLYFKFLLILLLYILSIDLLKALEVSGIHILQSNNGVAGSKKDGCVLLIGLCYQFREGWVCFYIPSLWYYIQYF